MRCERKIDFFGERDTVFYIIFFLQAFDYSSTTRDTMNRKTKRKRFFKEERDSKRYFIIYYFLRGEGFKKRRERRGEGKRRGIAFYIFIF